MAVTADDILDTVAKEALVERAKLTPEATLESLGIASLDIISIGFALEDQFGVALDQSEFERVRTVSDLLDLILGKAGAAPAAQSGA
jgi:acyl carrier protein